MKIKRDAFLYLEGDDNDHDFAQCGTCYLFVPEDERCAIHGNLRITADDSCGFYIEGAPSFDDTEKLVTPEESGLVHRETRCENCAYGGPTCKLYEMLNRELPHVFELTTEISPTSCCNAQVPKVKVAGGQ